MIDDGHPCSAKIGPDGPEKADETFELIINDSSDNSTMDVEVAPSSRNQSTGTKDQSTETKARLKQLEENLKCARSNEKKLKEKISKLSVQKSNMKIQLSNAVEGEEKAKSRALDLEWQLKEMTERAAKAEAAVTEAEAQIPSGATAVHLATAEARTVASALGGLAGGRRAWRPGCARAQAFQAG